MQSQIESDRLSLRTNLITTDRPDSSQLVDLHVYIIPKSVWKDRQNSAENEAMEQAISAGFVRVPQDLTIKDLRQYILDICGQDEEFPREFLYLRSVGRCLTKVKPQQENELRVKNYRPPTTFAPEIYILEGHHDDEAPTSANSKNFLYRESPIHHSLATPPHLPNSRPQSWIKPIATPPQPLSTYPSYTHANEEQSSINLNGLTNASISNLSTTSSTLSARELSKLREEQERLRLRQIELARQRREMEQEQQRREKQFAEKQKNHPKDEQDKEEIAAVRIQTAYRDYRTRRKTAEDQHRRQRTNFVKYRGWWSPEPEERRRQSSTKTRHVYSTPLEKSRTWRNEHQWSASSSMKIENNPTKTSDDNQSLELSSFRHAANELERLQKEARELTRRKAEEQHAEEVEAHDVAKISDQLEELRAKRLQLETTREEIVRRMQELHAQISVRRKEERDLWKQKYLVEKKKTTELEENTRATSKDEPGLKPQVEQAKIRLNNTTKLREQAENECRILQQELKQIRESVNTVEKPPIPKQPPHAAVPPQQHQQQRQSTIPINLDIVLQY